MNRLFLVVLALPLSGAPALSQSTTTVPPAPSAPAAQMPPASGVTPVPMPSGSTATMPSGTTATMPAAIAPSTAMPGGAAGSNSFTENQARSRLEANGYSGVAGLMKDQEGIWRGTAMKNGATVQVSLDYKGDIASR